MLRQLQLDNLESVFSDYSEIDGVYLFGSYASGKSSELSDLDLGIVYNNATIKEKKLDLYADLVKKGVEDVDIVFFNSADLVLQFEMIHHNQLIYRKEGFNHGELFSNTIRKYFDFKLFLDRQRKKRTDRGWLKTK